MYMHWLYIVHTCILINTLSHTGTVPVVTCTCTSTHMYIYNYMYMHTYCTCTYRTIHQCIISVF